MDKFKLYFIRQTKITNEQRLELDFDMYMIR